MSRRESRVSMNARQTDALFEFENFKKKFLLANKHITKLNSTLSIRIEELNAQISTLYTENLRLRASEINLAAQLKREREKSRKIFAETAAAALGLTKHLDHLRQAFSISEEASPSSPSSSPTPPRATQRPALSAESPNSPAFPRLSRPPTISLIHEDEEPSDPTEDEEVPITKQPSPRRKQKSKRLSASRLPLPLPARISSPPPVPQVPALDLNPTKRKPVRRQSGLLVRQGSPVVGPTEVEEEDEVAVALDEPADEEEREVQPVVRKEKRKSSKEKGKEKEYEVSLRKKLRNEIGDEGTKLTLADVTNSPRSRASQPVEPVVSEVELEFARPTSTSRREFGSSSSSRSNPNSYSQPSIGSLPLPPAEEQPESALAGARERRMRKSVNYAEPRLNTKMRKPDSEIGSTTSRKRKSAAAVLSSRAEERVSGHEADADGDLDERDGGARSSLEGPVRPHHTRVPDPTQLPLPASRPGSSADSYNATLPVPRVKSRPHLYAEDDISDESDDADTEYVPSGKSVTSWVNVSERKKSGTKIGAGKYVDEAGRRHSSAV
ncbi:hypothetical protein D9757_014457 [Collybiopsis confluens]|uniref:Shugoshin N-terminal coiled-coil domain-containing protein n=1 Tax=Collybiopsis confluens TaxID=2823264 RepID=A0A8H5FVI4_9AGAR|nr:hypothetical protein D9757_014457 [Collybiopsis confluens]